MGFFSRLKKRISGFFSGKKSPEAEPEAVEQVSEPVKSEAPVEPTPLTLEEIEPVISDEPTSPPERPRQGPALTNQQPAVQPPPMITADEEEFEFDDEPHIMSAPVAEAEPTAQPMVAAPAGPASAPAPAAMPTRGNGLLNRAMSQSSQPDYHEPVPASQQPTPPLDKKGLFTEVNAIAQSPTAQAQAATAPKQKKKRGKLRLSFRAHEIIPRNSPFNHYFRSLLNAERFIAEKEYSMALDVYQRLLNKIPNKTIREKILQNINDLEDFIENFEDEEEEQKPQPIQVVLEMPEKKEEPQEQKTDEGKSTTFGAPMGRWSGNTRTEKTETSNLEAEKIVQSITKGFFDIKKAMFEGKNLEILTQGNIELKGDIKAEMPSPPPGGTEDDKTKYIEKISDVANINKVADTANFGEGADGLKGKGEGEDAGEAESEAGGGGAPPLAEEPPEEVKAEPEPEPAQPEPETANMAPPSLGGEPAEEEAAPPSLDQASSVTGSTGGPEAEPEEEELIEPEPITDDEEAKPPVQEIRGVLELKTPEQEDTPFLTLTYDFTKIPHRFALSRNHTILEYAYYKYKSMLVKAQRFIKRKAITKALNYYRVIREQEIPDEFRAMIDKNIEDIKEYLQKYLMTRQG